MLTLCARWNALALHVGPAKPVLGKFGATLAAVFKPLHERSLCGSDCHSWKGTPRLA
jgi:hypothetical protein